MVGDDEGYINFCGGKIKNEYVLRKFYITESGYAKSAIADLGVA